MGDILSLARKLERAMRNRTGFNVTLDELDAMIEEDAIDGIYAAKLRKLKALCPAKIENTSSEITGSPSVAMASPGSTRSHHTSPEAAKSYIAALSASA